MRVGTLLLLFTATACSSSERSLISDSDAGVADEGTMTECDAAHCDGGVAPRPAACDDPSLKTRLDVCRAATDQASCLAAGGSWAAGGLALNPYCHCRTGQGGCPCSRAADCLGYCKAPTPANSQLPNYCAGVTSGMCTADVPTGGCYCVATDSMPDPFWELCQD